jgi:hypothetical protein
MVVGKPAALGRQQGDRHMPGSLAARGHHIERQLLACFCVKAKEVRIGETSHAAFHNRRNRKFLSFLDSVVGLLFNLAGPTGDAKQKWIGITSACFQMKDSGTRPSGCGKLHLCAERQDISRINRSCHIVAFTAQSAFGIEEITRQFQRDRLAGLTSKREHGADSGLANWNRRDAALAGNSRTDLG